ncbi:MAG TPA: glycosyltransferase [Nitrososphaerales archaeon]|nr:glycosyltransferase [Nitrososphaerales archaeon]
MARFLYSVSPVGLGHATRAIAVAAILQRNGHYIEFTSGGTAADMIESYGYRVSRLVEAPVPQVVGGEMKMAAMWYLRYWRAYSRTRERLRRHISESRQDLVVGDEEFASVTVAMQNGLPNALVTDELELNFARSAAARLIERRVAEWYKRLQTEVTALLIPDAGKDSGNVHHVSPIVRPVTLTRTEVVDEFALPERGTMILFSMSGAGVGESLLRRTAEAWRAASIPGSFLVVSGNRGEKLGGENVFDLGPVKENQNLVASADLVVSTAGKSTIDEADMSGTPIITIPIKNHWEQERNAEQLGFGPGDASRLVELIRERAGSRRAPHDYRGAENAAALLASLAGQ